MTTPIAISRHAQRRAIERFGVKPRDVDRWIRAKLDAASEVGEFVGADGNVGRAFAANGVVLIVSPARDKVITVMRPNVRGSFREKVQALADHERQAIERRYRRERRNVTQLEADIYGEMADVKLALMRSRSAARRMALQARLAALTDRLAELPADERQLARNKTKELTTVAAYM